MALVDPMARDGWGCLVPELLALCLQQLGRLVYGEDQQGSGDGMVGLRAAGRLMAAAGVNSHWRAGALAEVRCSSSAIS